MKHLITFILSVVLLTACGESERNNRLLQRAERVMDDSADVALAILCDSIDTTTLYTDRSRAIYALLLSQAYDKNYIDISSDSIIAPAVKYFADGNEPHYAMLAHYYHGRILENSGDAHNAIAQYTKATTFKNKTSSYLVHGLIYTHLGNLYSNSCDFPKSIEAYQNAYNSYKLADSYNHKIFALYDMARSYRGNQDYYNAHQVISQVINEATDSCDKKMIRLGNIERIIQYGNQNKYSEAISIYDSLCSKFTDIETSPFLHVAISTAYAHYNDTEKALQHIDSAWRRSDNLNDTIIIFYKTSKIYELLNDYPKSLECINNGITLENSKIRKELEQPLLTAQRDLLAQNLEISQYKQQLSKYVIIIIALISLIIIVSIIVFAKKLVRQKQQTINDYAESILDLHYRLKSKDDSYSTILNELFDKHYSILNDLGNTLADISDNASDQKRLYKEVKEIVSRFENPKVRLDLEQIINRYRSGLMKKLRADFPDLSNDEYQQICYHYAGFSPKFISLLMHQKTPTIYKRRARMKEKILSSDSQYKEKLSMYL